MFTSINLELFYIIMVWVFAIVCFLVIVSLVFLSLVIFDLNKNSWEDEPYQGGDDD